MGLKNKLFLAFLSVLVIGCSSTATSPVAQQETIDESQPMVVSEESAEPSDFDADGVTPIDDRGMAIKRTFYFDYDEAILGPDALVGLEVHAEILKRNPDKSVVVEGHCDERGTREYNLALGESSANAVKVYLITYGISSDRISVISYGKERPVDSGSNPLSWSKNRRSVTVKANKIYDFYLTLRF